MKIKKIEIDNFRLLRSFFLDIEDNLSLVIGKNNTGKTSVLTAIDKFINSSDKKNITIDDFNIELKKELLELIDGQQEILRKEDYIPLGISLKIFIEYDEGDDLSQVKSLIMSLDPEDRNIVLSFNYAINYQSLLAMKAAYQAEKDKYNDDSSLFLKDRQSEFFGAITKKSLLHSDHTVYVDLVKEGLSLQNIIAFDYISAKRSVTNKENDKTLSYQTSRIYKKTSSSPAQEEAVEQFKKKLRETDRELGGIYKDMFKGLLEKVSKFGGIKQNDTDVKIASTLQHRELLEGNTTVFYSHNDHELPEHYNGLGYMNLISMIFEIEILLAQFRRASKESPAAINLLFIEEPEAHTHPQMQYIFIKNIKSLLEESRKREDGIIIQLQTIISTHSSHIVSECDFDDIKYLKKNAEANSVSAKNLKSLEDEYTSENPVENILQKQAYKFLKQYLTLNRAELFFADKAIFIEGDTERILLPAMMKKLDLEVVDEIPLLSQNISIVEVGAHSQTFEKFISFIGVKTLIITDIDSFYDKPKLEDDGFTPKLHDNGSPKTEVKTCTPDDQNAKKTSNSSLLYFHNKKREDLEYFVALSLSQKVLAKKNDTWVPDVSGTLLLCYQTYENDYHARSFEDAFFSLNKQLLGNDAGAFPSMTKKWFNQYVVAEPSIGALEFSERAVGSKPSLAIEILLNSETVEKTEFANWKIPNYIKEGLEWLRKD